VLDESLVSSNLGGEEKIRKKYKMIGNLCGAF